MPEAGRSQRQMFSKRLALYVIDAAVVFGHRDRPYQAGRSKHWIKVKNRKHPAMERVMEALRAT